MGICVSERKSLLLVQCFSAETEHTWTLSFYSAAVNLQRIPLEMVINYISQQLFKKKKKSIFSSFSSEAVRLGRAMISHRAFYLLQYVDVINLGL